MPENNTENSITVEIKNGEIIKPANQEDNSLWQSIKNLWNGFINYKDTPANIVGGFGLKKVEQQMKLVASFDEKYLEQQKSNPNLNPLDATISAGGQVLTEYVLSEALNYGSQSNFLPSSNTATFSGVRVIDNNQNSIFDIAISEINSDVAKKAAQPINDIIKKYYNNKNNENELILKDPESESKITLKDNACFIDTENPLSDLAKLDLATNILSTSITINPGDTLSAIAQKYGTTVPELQKLNNIDNPNQIESGKKLKIREDDNNPDSKTISIDNNGQVSNYKKTDGDTETLLTNSGLIATDAVYVDSDGNPASMYVVEDENGKKQTIKQEGITVEGIDGKQHNVDRLVEMDQTAGQYLKQFTNSITDYLTKPFQDTSNLAYMTTSIVAELARGGDINDVIERIAIQEYIAKPITTMGVEYVTNQLGLNLTQNDVTELIQFNEGTIDNVSGDLSSKLLKSEGVKAGVQALVTFAITAIVNGKDMDSEDYAMAAANIGVSQAIGWGVNALMGTTTSSTASQVAAQAATNAAASGGGATTAATTTASTNSFLGASTPMEAGAGGIAVAVTHIAIAGIQDIGAEDSMNSHQWQSTVLTGAAMGVAYFLGSLTPLGPLGGMIATIALSAILGGKEFKDGEYPDPYSFLQIVAKEDGSGNTIYAIEKDGTLARARDGFDDDIIGSSGNDILVGGTGTNVISGNGGNDHIEGRSSNDQLFGGAGDDLIEAGAGDDAVLGGDGNDIIHAGIGDDQIDAGAGSDIIIAGSGNDVVIAGDGEDVVYGDEGDDQISSGLGNDLVIGGIGSDTLIGEAGRDRIYGGEDNDQLFGEDGNDILIAGSGNDNVYGGNNDDQIIGGSGVDMLYGDSGHDTIAGGEDNDLIFGGLGNDEIGGGTGNDTLLGEIGDDMISGGEGVDTIDGGDGIDIISGDKGNDILSGGAGDDTYIFKSGDGQDEITDTSGALDTLRFINLDVANVNFTKSGNDLVISFSGSTDSVTIKDNFSGNVFNPTIEILEFTSIGVAGGNSIDLTAVTYDSGSNSFNYSSSNIVNEDVTLQNVLLDDSKGAVTSLDNFYADQQGVDLDVTEQLYNNIDYEFYNDIEWRSYKKKRGSFGGHYTVWYKHYEKYVNGFDNSDDRLVGNFWDEIINGKSGDDFLYGNNGNDTIYGEDGNDFLEGGSGNDTLYGGVGGDNLEGGSGNDVLNSGSGDDKISAGEGDDIVNASSGNNTIVAEFGNNIINADGGDNVIVAGEGNDLVTVQNGNNIIDLGDGNNSLTAGDGNNLIESGTGIDRITAQNGNNNIRTDAGNDYINVGNGNNFINSGTGDDLIVTGNGNNTIYADDGNDKLFVGSGDNEVYLGYGNDTLNIGLGNNNIYSDAGNNIITISANPFSSRDDAIDEFNNINVNSLIESQSLLSSNALTTNYFSNIRTAHGNDQIKIASGSTIINTGDGDDNLEIGDSNDNNISHQVNLNQGNNILKTGNGDITLSADDGNNKITTGNGQSDIDLGDGNNELTTNAGNANINIGDGNNIINLNGEILEFDHEYYIQNYGEEIPDLGLGIDANAKKHFDEVGKYRNFNPNEYFDTEFYLANNDVTLAENQTPFDHYLEIGSKENYLPNGNLQDSKNIVNLGDGNNIISGDNSVNELNIGDGNNVINTNINNDKIIVGNGNNQINSGAGNDEVTAGNGSNIINSGSGDDILSIGNGDNIIDLGSDNDNLTIGDGNNEINLGSGDDIIITGSGNNQINAGTGDDVIIGGAGDNIYIYNKGDGNDIINVKDEQSFFSAEKQNSVLDFQDLKAKDIRLNKDNDNLTITIKSTNHIITINNYFIANNNTIDILRFADNYEINLGDIYVGTEQKDELTGSDDADQALLNGGNDIVLSFSGDDYVNGGTGGDLIFAGDDNDVIDGNEGDDYIDAGGGDDLIITGAGNDRIFGGEGKDNFVISKAENSNDVISDFDIQNDILDLSEFGRDFTDLKSLKTLYGIKTDHSGNVILNLPNSQTLTLSGITTENLEELNIKFDIEQKTGLIGDENNNILTGTDGSDEIFSGAGNDILTGNAGEDIFVISQNINGVDIIEDFKTHEDIIRFDDTNEITFNQLNIEQKDSNSIITLENNQKLILRDVNKNNLTENHFQFNQFNGIGIHQRFSGDYNVVESTIIEDSSNINPDSIDYFMPNEASAGFTGSGIDSTNYWTSANIHNEGIDAALFNREYAAYTGGKHGFWYTARNTNFHGRDPHWENKWEGCKIRETIWHNGNDQMHGAWWNENIWGKGGHDQIFGNNGHDTIWAGNGNDSAHGGNHNDTIHGENGNDYLTGDSGHDRLYGGNNNDYLHGGNDNDYLHGGNHDDKLVGGHGYDELHGANGNDRLYGENHNDRLYGGHGNDYLHGQNHNDYLHGGTGRDTLVGGHGHDELHGADGNDYLDGGQHNDRLYGGNHNDIIFGGTGSDNLQGGNHNDILYGGTEGDILHGQNGDDYLDGGYGEDRAYGGNGNDYIIGGSDNKDDLLAGDSGHDKIIASTGNNIIDGGSGVDQIQGGSGNDIIYGNSGEDIISGGAGSDIIYGGTNNDIIDGESENDYLLGGQGDDIIYGSFGNDFLVGGSNNDILYGNDDHDLLHGNSGNDNLFGGSGNDILEGGNNYYFDYKESLHTWVGGSIAGSEIDINRIKIGDFNGDGKDDLYYIQGWNNSAYDSIFLSNGDGTFAYQQGLQIWVGGTLEAANIDISRVKIGDFNGDGKDDIYHIQGWENAATDHIYLSNGDGSFGYKQGLNSWVGGSIEGAKTDIARIKIGDFNGDNKDDIYYVNGWESAAKDAIYLSNDSSGFSYKEGLSTWVGGSLDGSKTDIARIKIADIDGDNKDDIYYVNGWESAAKDAIYLSNDSSGFSYKEGLSTWVGGSLDGSKIDLSRIKFADINGDNKDDIYYVNGWGGSSQDHIHLSNGDGSFDYTSGINSWIYPALDGAKIDISRIKFGDFDNNGKDDIYYVNGWESYVRDNIYFSKEGVDNLTGGQDSDLLKGGIGNDIYHYNFGDGSDLLFENANEGYDIIKFSGNITKDSINILQNNDDLIISFKDNDHKITIINQFKDNLPKIEKLEFSDNSALLLADIGSQNIINAIISDKEGNINSSAIQMGTFFMINEDNQIKIPAGEDTILSNIISPNGDFILDAENLIFTPNENYFGLTNISYDLTDESGNVNSYNYTIAINPVNDAPILNLAGAKLNEDSSIEIDVLANASDIEDQNLTNLEIGIAKNGKVEITPDNKIKYTPNPDYFGTDSFEYAVTDSEGLTTSKVLNVIINNIEDVPIIVDELNIKSAEDQSITIDINDHAFDGDGDELIIIEATNPTNGAVTIENNNQLIYTPNANYNGIDSFNYVISDGKTELTKTINLEISSENDAPIVISSEVSVNEDGAVIIDILRDVIDSDGDNVVIESISNPTNGAAEIIENKIVYIPKENFNGNDSLIYTISDGNGGIVTKKLDININSINDAPILEIINGDLREDEILTINVLKNATDIENDELTITEVKNITNGHATIVNNEIIYIPDQNYHGNASLDYIISDGVNNIEKTLNINIESVNDLPIAILSESTLNEDSSINIDVLSFASDVDGDILTISGITNPANGSALIENGQITYTPNANYFGSDSFDYLISDGNGGVISKTLTLTVNNVNDAPEITIEGTIDINEDNIAKINILEHATDIDGDELSLISADNAENGTLTIEGGEIIYTPDQDYFGEENITYIVSDGAAQVEKELTINIASVNDNPIANDDQITTLEDNQVIIDLLSNDKDVEDKELKRENILLGGALYGTVFLNENNQIIYTPNQDYFGTDSFIYAVKDSDGAFSNIATAHINIEGVNDAPIVVNDFNDQMIRAGEENIITIPDNIFNDVDGDNLDISLKLKNGDPLPDWINYDAQTGTITSNATNNNIGAINLILTASDGKYETSQEFTLVVKESLQVRNDDRINIIEGGKESDLVVANAGTTDLIFGGAGNDTIAYNIDDVWFDGYSAKNSYTGDEISITGKIRSYDAFDGGKGESDTLYLTEGDDVIFLHDLISDNPTISGSRLFGIEVINALSGSDVIDLSSDVFTYGSVTINGSDGDDVLWSNDGNDIINGEGGNDSIVGGRGDDILNGGDGDDVIKGFDGDDTLLGGIGKDILNGGSGSDIFDFTNIDWSKSENPDIIQDFEKGIDLIQISNSGLSFDDLDISNDGVDTFILEENNEFAIILNGVFNLSAEDFNIS